MEISVKILHEMHVITYFVGDFHSDWLFFPRVMPENKSGCFILNTVYVSGDRSKQRYN